MSSMSDSGTSGRGGAELMVEQFHLKVLHAVLAVRGPRPPLQLAASASFRQRDRRFHLPLHDPPPPPAAEGVEAPAPGEPLVVDIHLAPAGGGGAGGEVVERWTVACEPWLDAAAAAAGEAIPVNRAYKRCMTMLRSVYATLRFLPAYRVFRLLCANQSYNYEMVHRVRSFGVPLSRDKEAAMRSYSFVPVETQHGRLVVSVQYLPSLAAFNLEISSLSPSMLIPDYVGSPAAEPMRAFPASLTEATGSAFPLSNQPQRPHSWAPPALWPQAPTQQPYASSLHRHSDAATLCKVKDSKDESGRFPALSSCDSPWRDDIDDVDYPFAVDDVDTPSSQPGSNDGKEARDQASSSSHKSQDAAVGSLVHLLKTARPLRNFNCPSQASAVESNEATSTSSVVSRRKSDALEELQSFKEIKERLMSPSRAKQHESPGKPKQQEPPEKP